jgi:hypothetical protein
MARVTAGCPGGGTMSDADNDRECTAADGWARAYTT